MFNFSRTYTRIITATGINDDTPKKTSDIAVAYKKIDAAIWGQSKILWGQMVVN